MCQLFMRSVIFVYQPQCCLEFRMGPLPSDLKSRGRPSPWANHKGCRRLQRKFRIEGSKEPARLPETLLQGYTRQTLGA